MMKTNRFTQALVAQDKQIGIWMSMCSNIAADVVAPGGYDWALIDMEHTANDYRSVLSQLQAFASSDTTAIVRVEWNDAVAVKRLLDLGAPGLLFPMIQTVAEAERAVAATRYPPHGVRGFSGATRATDYGRIKTYVDKVDAETTVLIQLETRSAIAQAERIGAVDGVSGVFFGPADIAADIGRTGQPMHPDVWDLIKPAAQKLNAMGVPVGTLVLDPAFATDLLNEGFTFVACGTDASVLARAVDAQLAQIQGGLTSQKERPDA